MSDPLEKTFLRLWSLTAGVAMVVTDLHGDWDAYRRYRDRFVDLQATGRVDHLILTGDLIHRETTSEPDDSLKIVLDVLALREVYGSSVIYLCGNHEMPHLYGISLARGNRLYTPDFEAALSRSGRRAVVVERHLRLASARHAKPREAGQYLLFDAAQPVQQMSQILSGLGTVYKQ